MKLHSSASNAQQAHKRRRTRRSSDIASLRIRDLSTSADQPISVQLCASEIVQSSPKRLGTPQREGIAGTPRRRPRSSSPFSNPPRPSLKQLSPCAWYFRRFGRETNRQCNTVMDNGCESGRDRMEGRRLETLPRASCGARTHNLSEITTETILTSHSSTSLPLR